jgi:HSP20 family protein
MPRSFPADFEQVEEDMDRLFDGLLSGTAILHRPRRPTSALWRPMADVCETEAYVVVTFELPGVDRDSLELTMVGSELTVRGTRRRRQLSCGYSCRRLEIQSGPFERVVHVGVAVNLAESKAIYEDGLLEVTLPKTDQAKTQSISVNIQ